MLSIIKGLSGTIGLLALYAVAVSLVSGVEFANSQFIGNWYWILGLALGFGVQVGLFSHLRVLHRAQVSRGMVVASGGASGVAMLACCTHYLVNILPIVGISGLAAVVGEYQTWLFGVGAAANIVGIGYLVKKLKGQSPSTSACHA